MSHTIAGIIKERTFEKQLSGVLYNWFGLLILASATSFIFGLLLAINGFDAGVLFKNMTGLTILAFVFIVASLAFHFTAAIKQTRKLFESALKNDDSGNSGASILRGLPAET